MTQVAALAWLRADDRRIDGALALITTGVASLLFWAGPDEFDTGWPDVAAGVGAFMLVALRRRHSLALLGVALVWTAVHVAVLERPTVMIFATLVLLATVCVQIDRWPAIGLGAAIAASLYMIGLIGNDAESGDARAVIGIAWTAVAVALADAIRSWRQYRDAANAQIRSAVLAAGPRPATKSARSDSPSPANSMTSLPTTSRS